MLNDLDYADDIALLENTIPRANAQLNTLSAEARPVGLEINTDKTEYMVICPASKADEFAEPLVLNNNQLARVKNFTYLGANMQSSFCDMSHRKGKAWAAFWSLKDISNRRGAQDLHIQSGSTFSVLLRLRNMDLD